MSTTISLAILIYSTLTLSYGDKQININNKQKPTIPIPDTYTCVIIDALTHKPTHAHDSISVHGFMSVYKLVTACWLRFSGLITHFTDRRHRREWTATIIKKKCKHSLTRLVIIMRVRHEGHVIKIRFIVFRRFRAVIVFIFIFFKSRL